MLLGGAVDEANGRVERRRHDGYEGWKDRGGRAAAPDRSPSSRDGGLNQGQGKGRGERQRVVRSDGMSDAETRMRL